ncbi:MAG: phospholipid carrier-dependent glycosyltransferase [Patescibacteria group bacterium]
MTKSWQRLLVLFLLLFAFVLRAWKLDANPPSLNWDEVSHGYNAYSILKTGKDEWGTTLPLIFRAYGDQKLPLYIYLTVLPVAFLGLNPLSVRLVSVLSGVGLVLVAYLLGKKLIKNSWGGLLTGLLVAVSPWSLFLSRVAVEANLAVFLFALACWLWIQKKLNWATLFWGLSLYSYNSARVVVPIVFVLGLLGYLKKRQFKKILAPVLIMLFFLIPVGIQFFNQTGGARFYWVSPVDQGAVNRIVERRTSSSLPVSVNRLIYNRPVYFVAYSARNYLMHFSPTFLFLGGGDHYQFSTPGWGLLPLITAPFLLIGIFSLLKRRAWFWLLLMATTIVPSAITRDSPHVLRSILILPWPMLLTALGLSDLLDWLRSRSKLNGRLLLLVFPILILISFSFWWRDYWRNYRTNYSWAWQSAYPEMVDYLKEHYSEYDKIVISKKYGEPHEFLLFYWPWDPISYQSDSGKKWDYHANWYWVDGFDKFEFWNDWEVAEKSKELSAGTLLVASPGSWNPKGELLEKISFLDQSAAFDLVRY